jgi:hypothetical protein
MLDAIAVHQLLIMQINQLCTASFIVLDRCINRIRNRRLNMQAAIGTDFN